MAITQGTFDVIFDAIKTTLDEYNSKQAPADQFTVKADWYRSADALTAGAYIFMYLGTITPTDRTTEGYQQQTVTYFIDMIVSKKGRTGATYNRADEAAGVRYRLLIQQVLSALNGTNNFNFGEPVGTIGTKEMRIDTTIIDSQVGEQQVAAGRLTLTLSMCFAPDELSGIDLEAIMITADKWSALIEP